MIKNKSNTVFDFINISLLSVIFVIVLYPLLYVIAASVSDPVKVAGGQIFLLPKGINLEAYKNVFINEEIWIGYRNSIMYTVLGTSINLFTTITCAFALARKKLKGRNFIMAVYVFTMYFSGGIIPTYILINHMKMNNTILAMIIPGAMSVYNMIICRTYYQNNIPEELYESSKMDGANDIRMFLTIAVPLSAPIIAVMALFYGVGHWNAFFNALIYITKQELYPLQIILRNILLLNQQMNMDLSSMSAEELEYITKEAMMAETMKYALIIIASLPVLAAYPFIQRYFVKGIMIGAIKG